MTMKPVRLLCYTFSFGLDGAQPSIAFPSFGSLMTNKNVALINSVTIYEQKTKDCEPLGNFQHKLLHRYFYF